MWITRKQRMCTKQQMNSSIPTTLLQCMATLKSMTCVFDSHSYPDAVAIVANNSDSFCVYTWIEGGIQLLRVCSCTELLRLGVFVHWFRNQWSGWKLIWGRGSLLIFFFPLFFLFFSFPLLCLPARSQCIYGWSLQRFWFAASCLFVQCNGGHWLQ